MKEARAGGLRPFYVVLGIVAVIGLGLILWAGYGPGSAPVAVDLDAVAAGEAEPYVLGNPNAPVQIVEFADFECPACANFAVVTESDVRARLVETGVANVQFYDFPLPMHRNSVAASLAAACAAEQNRFWEMHDLIFANQPQWATEATGNPFPIFRQLAERIGLDVPQFEQCFTERRHLQRIKANQAYAERLGITSTPTFVIGGQRYPGSLSFDEINRLVQAEAREFTARATGADTARDTAGGASPRP